MVRDCSNFFFAVAELQLQPEYFEHYELAVISV